MLFGSKKPRALNQEEIAALIQFRDLQIDLDELLRRTPGIGIDFGPSQRTLSFRYLTPVPGIQIELMHVQNAIAKKNAGDVSEKATMDWATMILLNDAYDWEGLDEEEISDGLHKLSMPRR